MTVDATGYFVAGDNFPLHYSRILWDMVAGTLTSADGVGSATLAGNDYTHQRWASNRNLSVEDDWIQLTAGEVFNTDMVFIAAHNLDGIASTFTIQTAPEIEAPFTWTTRATVTPAEPGAIAIMFNEGGTPVVAGAVRLHIAVEGAEDSPTIGIFRTGVAMQMCRPLSNTQPIGLRAQKTLKYLDSETGQPLVRAVERRRKSAFVTWPAISSAWYRTEYQPFAETLPERPFAFVQNASSMPESVVWAWTNEDPAPQTVNGLNMMDVSLEIMGYDG